MRRLFSTIMEVFKHQSIKLSKALEGSFRGAKHDHQALKQLEQALNATDFGEDAVEEVINQIQVASYNIDKVPRHNRKPFPMIESPFPVNQQIPHSEQNPTSEMFTYSAKNSLFRQGLSIVFFSVCIIHTTLIVFGRHAEGMWMVFGTLAMIILLIEVPKSFASVLLVVIFGTFVADEEFLLEVAAISKGENITEVRGSREFEPNYITSEEENIEQFTEKLKLLISNNAPPDEIIEILYMDRIETQISKDLALFDQIDKDVILTFARYGILEESVFFDLMEQKKYSTDEIKDSVKKLMASDYITTLQNKKNQAKLSRMGLALAKTFGLKDDQIIYIQTLIE